MGPVRRIRELILQRILQRMFDAAGAGQVTT